MVQFSLIKSVQIKSSEIRIKNSELTVDFDSTHDSGRPSDAPAHLSTGPPSTDPTPPLGPQHIRLSPLPADSTTSKSTAPADQRTSQSALADGSRSRPQLSKSLDNTKLQEIHSKIADSESKTLLQTTKFQ